MSYKLKYKEALKAAGITEDDLLPKTKQALKDLLELKAVAESEDDEDEKKAALLSLEALDNELCKKIARNEATKANVVKMQSARGKSKQVATEPVKEAVIEKPKVDEPILEEGGKADEPKSESGLGWILGIGASVIGVVAFGKWKKWF